MHFPPLFIFPQTYARSHINYMATKSKDITNNGIYYVLIGLAMEATKNLHVAQFSPA